MTLANTTCKLPEDGVLTPKHVGVILQYLFVHMLVYNKQVIKLLYNMDGMNIKVNLVA